MKNFSLPSGVAKGGKWGHAPRGAGLRGASARFLQPFKNAKQKFKPIF